MRKEVYRDVLLVQIFNTIFWMGCGIDGNFTFLSNKYRVLQGERLAPLCSDLFTMKIQEQQDYNRQELFNNIAQRPECAAHTMQLDIMHSAFIRSPIAHLLLFMLIQARQTLIEARDHGPPPNPRRLQPGIEHCYIGLAILSYSVLVLLHVPEEKTEQSVFVGSFSGPEYRFRRSG
ncbi:MAG: hypothetical protein ABGY11_11540 [Candidatus Thioglobus sp.]